VPFPRRFVYQLFGYNRNREPAALPGAATPESANEKVIRICYRSISPRFPAGTANGKTGHFYRKRARESYFYPDRGPSRSAIVLQRPLADKAAVDVPESFNPSASGSSSLMSERSRRASAAIYRQSRK
jgi:hypothetical protein